LTLKRSLHIFNRGKIRIVNPSAIKVDETEPTARQLGIGTKFTLLLCVMTIVAASAVGLTTYWQFNRALVNQELQTLSSLARIKAVRLTSEMEALRADTLLISNAPAVKQFLNAQQDVGGAPLSDEVVRTRRKRLEEFFQEILRAKPRYGQVRLIGIADGGREVVRVDRELESRDLTAMRPQELQQKGKEPYFPATLQLPRGDVFLSDVNLNREHDQIELPLTPVIRAATPVFDQNETPVAIVVINAYFQSIARELREGLREHESLLVTNDQGDFLAHPDFARCFGFDRGQMSRIQDDFPALSAAFKNAQIPAYAIVDRSKAGQDVAIGMDRAAFDPSHPGRFLAIAIVSGYDAAVPSSARSGNRSLMACAAVLLIAVVSGYFLSRSVTGPLRQIAATADAFGRGTTDAALPIGSRDEVGIVARSLNSMMAEVQRAHTNLKSRAEELEESRRSALNMLQDVESSRAKAALAERLARDQAARTQAILDGASDAIITISSAGEIESFNTAAEHIFGYAADEVVGRNVNVLMPSPYHEEHDGYLHYYLTTGISKIIGIGREVLGLRKDGSQFPMHLAISDVKLGDRRLFTGIVRDISDLKQAMQQLTAANDELARRSEQIERFNLDLSRSNEELKQFAYVASHDLQEPLRKITAFCQMLRDDYGDKLDDDARTYIQYAVDGALRMRTLIQDLLAFSRVETQGKPLEPTDADDACNEAVENLAMAIHEAAAEVTRDPLPMVQADRAQLVRLFQNLIGNAIKYRAQELPRIHISVEESGGQWLFRVRDNGIGIDPQYHERVFVIFQRLHGREEYSGTGIGLAVCKRIVERAGGRIWVESRAGEGSVFCFTLAKSHCDAFSSNSETEPDQSGDNLIDNLAFDQTLSTHRIPAS
jgi:PAS domain S-box-containing protein